MFGSSTFYRQRHQPGNSAIAIPTPQSVHHGEPAHHDQAVWSSADDRNARHEISDASIISNIWQAVGRFIDRFHSPLCNDFRIFTENRGIMDSLMNKFNLVLHQFYSQFGWSNQCSMSGKLAQQLQFLLDQEFVSVIKEFIDSALLLQNPLSFVTKLPVHGSCPVATEQVLTSPPQTNTDDEDSCWRDLMLDNFLSDDLLSEEVFCL